MTGAMTAGTLAGGTAEAAATSEALATLGEGLLAVLAPEIIIPVLAGVALAALAAFALSKVGSSSEECSSEKEKSTSEEKTTSDVTHDGGDGGGGGGDEGGGDDQAKQGDKANQTTRSGGPHRETSKPPNDGMDSHHTPAKQAYKGTNLDPNDGPAIKMEPADHARTASYGNSEEAEAYRQAQRELIQKGEFKKAVDMDVKDIETKFPGKYDEALKEMQDYADTIDPKTLVPKK